MGRDATDALFSFPFDVNFFYERKHRILLNQKGRDGLLAYIYILTQIFHSEPGFYIKADDDFFEGMALDLCMSEDAIHELLHFLVIRSMFNEQLYNSDKVLTNEYVQSTYQRCISDRISKRGRDFEVDSKKWLLPKEKTASFIKVMHFSDKSPRNSNTSPRNSNTSPRNDTKKRKEKKNIENESKTEKRNSTVSSAIKTYEMNIGFPSTIIVQKIEDWLTDVDVSLLEYAIDQAVLHNKKSWPYIEAILRTQFNNGNKTRLSAEAINGRITHSNENPFFKLMKEMEEDDEEGNDFVTVDA